MTILPDDRYLSVWQRAKARLLTLINGFTGWWCMDDNVRLPDWWKPDQVERGGGSDG
jgi:hypothetical protein